MRERPRGWCPDPFLRHQLRFWDGTVWTAHVRAVPGAGPALLAAGGPDGHPAAGRSAGRPLTWRRVRPAARPALWSVAVFAVVVGLAAVSPQLGAPSRPQPDRIAVTVPVTAPAGGTVTGDIVTGGTVTGDIVAGGTVAEIAAPAR